MLKKTKKERTCSTCGKKFISGGAAYCEDCRAIYDKYYDEHGPERSKTEGITTWPQAESLIREMAELQYEIRSEYAAMDKRICLIKNYTAETVELPVVRSMFLESMLKRFLEDKRRKTYVPGRHRFRFGSMTYRAGRLILELDAETARRMKDRP